MRAWSRSFPVMNYKCIASTAGALFLMAEAVAFAQTPLGDLQIDGDQIDEPVATPGFDWKEIFPFTDLKQKRDCGLNLGIPGCPGGNKDDSFKGGVKEADPPSFGTPGVPPKDDLTRFMAYSQVLPNGGDPQLILNLGFERQAPSDLNGDANIDFEINQSQTFVNGVASRSLGDLLVAFNYSSGGDEITIYLLEWITPSAPGDCAITGSDPTRCWGECRRILGDITEPLETNCDEATADEFAAAQVNHVTLPSTKTAPFTGSLTGPELKPLQWGEMSINLTAAGVVDPDECKPFSSGYVKSRASTSISSQLKDVIKSQSIDLSLCKNLRIIKTDDLSPANPVDGATFEIYENIGAATCDEEDLDGALIDDCVTGAGGTAGECLITDLLPGEYCVYEAEAPEGYDLPDDPFQSFSTEGDETTVEVTFVDPALHKVIVLVCHQVAKKLHSSKYSFQGNPTEFQSLAAGDPITALLEAFLCGLEGDEGYAHGETSKTLTVDIPSHP